MIHDLYLLLSQDIAKIPQGSRPEPSPPKSEPSAAKLGRAIIC